MAVALLLVAVVFVVPVVSVEFVVAVVYYMYLPRDLYTVPVVSVVTFVLKSKLKKTTLLLNRQCLLVK